MIFVYIIAGAMLLYVAYIIGLIYWDLLTGPDDKHDEYANTCDSCRFNRCSWRGTYSLKDCGAWEPNEAEE